jgi:hypothetical protein
MKSCVFRATKLLQAITVVGAIGFAAPASVALAQGASQGQKSESSAAASKPGSVGGVVVQAPPKLNKIPPEKKKAFDAEVAKREAWQKYRQAPAATATTGATAGVSATARAENYPGLRSMGSH